MNKIMLASFAALSLLSFTGCKKKGGAAGEAIAKMESFSKEMCECKDKACADGVNKKMADWGTEMAKTAGKADDKPDPEMTKKSTEIMTKYTECMTKLMMADMPKPPPAEPPPAAPPAGSAAEPAPAAGGSAEPAPAPAPAGSGDAPK